jgi:hypothetical protein
LRRRRGHPLATAGWRFGSAGREKRDQVVYFIRFENFSERGHPVTSLDDLLLDPLRGVVLTDGAEVGRAVSADSGDAVATFAAAAVEDGCALPARVGAGGIGGAVTCHHEGGNGKAQDGDKDSQSSRRLDRHVQIILSKTEAASWLRLMRVAIGAFSYVNRLRESPGANLSPRG